MTEIAMSKTEKLDMIVEGDLDVTLYVTYKRKRKLHINGMLVRHPTTAGWYVLTTRSSFFEFDGQKAYHINVNAPSLSVNRDHVSSLEN